MNEKIDVLAVMDEAIVVLKSARLGANSESIGGVTVESVQAACSRIAGRLEHVEAARAAIAELIEAATEMRAEARRLRGDFIPADTLDVFDAALARVGGA